MWKTPSIDNITPFLSFLAILFPALYAGTYSEIYMLFLPGFVLGLLPTRYDQKIPDLVFVLFTGMVLVAMRDYFIGLFGGAASVLDVLNLYMPIMLLFMVGFMVGFGINTLLTFKRLGVYKYVLERLSIARIFIALGALFLVLFFITLTDSITWLHGDYASSIWKSWAFIFACAIWLVGYRIQHKH